MLCDYCSDLTLNTAEDNCSSAVHFEAFLGLVQRAGSPSAIPINPSDDVGKATHPPRAAAISEYLRLRMEHSYENAPLAHYKRFRGVFISARLKFNIRRGQPGQLRGLPGLRGFLNFA